MVVLAVGEGLGGRWVAGKMGWREDGPEGVVWGLGWEEFGEGLLGWGKDWGEIGF